MAISARMSSNWALRMGIVAVAFSAFAAWCVLDAKVGYPRFNQRAVEYNRLLAAGQIEQWPAYAEGKGWSASFSTGDHLPNGAISVKTAWDIGTQYVMMGGCLLVVTVVLYRLVRARGRTLQADDADFVTVEGLRVPYADIVGIDLRRWQSKSIARVRFRHGRGQRTTDIDDWIYRGGDAVLAELQRRTGLGAASVPALEAALVAPAVAPESGLAAPVSPTPEEPHDRAS